MRVFARGLLITALLLHCAFLYADTPPEFVETFESYAMGGASFDSLDKNDSLGPNQAPNGSGNPWWGSLPPNGRIDTSMAHSGSKSLRGTAGGCKDLCNVQYRIGGGAPLLGNIYLDWWFYDPLGPGGTTMDFCADYTAVSFYPGVPTHSDHSNPVPNPLPESIGLLALGMSDDISYGYDASKYQVRVLGDSEGYHNGWSNGGVTRSVGWHHARVVIGPRKLHSNTNDVVFFIDNMESAIIGVKDSVTTTGYNVIEVNTIMPSAIEDSDGGYIYSKPLRYSNVDDINMGTLATPVTGAPSTDVSTSHITWNWIINASDGNGLTMWNSATQGSALATVDAAVSTYSESGLLANTTYYRYVDSRTTRFCGVVHGYRSPLPPTATIPLPPVYGNIDNGIRCGYGAGGNTTPYPAGQAVTAFSAARGFGSGPMRASKYLYFWNTSPTAPSDWTDAFQWNSGSLVKTPYETGSYYLHLRACNADGASNAATLTLGPYNYALYTPVSRISQLWPLENGPRYALPPKTISAVWSDGFWIEELDRSAGIKVQWSGTAFAPNSAVQVYGYLHTGDERVLIADYVLGNGDGAPIKPLATNAQNIGGRAVNSPTPGVAGGLGIYSVGLLVRVTGTAGNAGTDFFYLDDGSGLTDGAIRGLKIVCGSLAPATSGPQAVTGVVGIVAGKPVIYATSLQSP